jgi:Carboxypeptidase regulatory-like domain
MLKLALCICLLGYRAQAQDRPDDSASLPINRVVLYKNGVGYFEHLGRIQNNQQVTIAFTSGQLNDVLKSLTVLDLNGGSVTGVAYGSAAPVEKQLGDLRMGTDQNPSLADFLQGLRGARLEVKNGSAILTGRLLSVEHKTRVSGGTTLAVDYVSLIADSGEIHTTEISPAFSVRLVERGLTGKVEHFLDLVSSEREPDVRRMIISTAGTGERSLFVSYISEVPIWKTTYRIVLGSKTGANPLLQGWAIVDNTVGEDWDKVELSLVAGAPQSFIQNLSQPYYARRPVVPLPGAMTTTPQTYESTLIPGGPRLTGTVTDPSGAVVAGASVKAFDPGGALAGETSTNAAGVYELRGLPEGALRLEVSSPGFNRALIAGVASSRTKPVQQDVRLEIASANDAVSVAAAAPAMQTESSALTAVPRSGRGGSLGSGAELGGTRRPGFGAGAGGGFGGGTFNVDEARARAEAAARARELGDLFEYKLKERISIPKNRSALVPIVQSTIKAEKVSIWNDGAGLPRPQRALWITNTSGLTLDGGSFSVLEEETFAGEGIFDPIRPNEKRLVSYATDLALNASSTEASEPQRVTRVIVSRGMMIHKSEVREKKTYTFRNEDSSPRTVVVEHPVRSRYELRSAVQPAETTAAWMRFRLEVGAKQTQTLAIEEARPIEFTYALTNISSAQVASLVEQRSIDKSVEEALRRVLAQKDVIEGLEQQNNAREEEKQRIFDDQQRLRENMKALKGSAEERALVQRYTQQLNDQETRLESLRKEIAETAAKREIAQGVLDRMIAELSFDVKL